MSKETDELEVAENRIKELEMELEKKNTPKQESRKEDQLTTALIRLEALEAKSTPQKVYGKEEEEDGDQCPQCGHVLTEVGDGTYYCNGCQDYFEDED